MVTSLLAHMGGIDEIGIFVIPAVLAIWALRRAERLARKRAEAEAAMEQAEAAMEQAEAVDKGTRTEAAPPL